LKLAFNTWVYSSFPVWVPAYPLEETIRRIASIGYDGIEIGAAAPHAFPDYLGPERRREIRKVLESSGIALASMLPAPGGGTGFNVASPMKEERAAAIDQYKKVVALCSEWGGKTVLYVAGWQIFGTPREEAFAWSREALAEIADFAAGQGVTIAVEPTSADSNLIDSCDDVIALMKAVGKTNVKGMFDTYHTLYRNEVPTDYVYRLGKDLAHVHLADADRNPPGPGRIDYPGLVAALRTVGFEGYLTMEIGFNRRAVDPDLCARQAYDYIKPLL
jgi:fructoselysine 3-epimerase